MLAAAWLALAALLIGIQLLGVPFYPVAWFSLGALLLVGLGLAYVLWHADPAWILSAAVVAAIFSGQWEEFGLGQNIAPDRMLLLAAIIVVALRGPAVRTRPKLRLRPVHLALAAAAAYVIGSAIASETLLGGSSPYRLLDRFSLVAFVVFALAPAAFRTEYQRRVLLGTLVALGGYLGLVALFETVGLRELIFPSYINDSSIGIHYGRARGPFLESSADASVMFSCAVAAAIAVWMWRAPLARAAAGAVVVLCLAGELFTLLRSAWIASALAAVISMLAFRRLRRYLVPVALAGVIAVAGALAIVPDLSERVEKRKANRLTQWDREAQYRAAWNMFEDRPLLGYGWETYSQQSVAHVEMDPEEPFFLSRTGERTVHNVALGNLAELGLVGTSLWLLATALAVGGALFTRGPPELRPWRIGLVAIAVHWAVLIAFTPMPTVLPNLMLWLWAGVATGPAAFAASGAREPIIRRRAGPLPELGHA